MFTKQISVFLENTTGSLHAMTHLLGESGVDLIALSIADSDSFGVLRCVTNSGDIPKALAALRRHVEGEAAKGNAEASLLLREWK